MCAQFVNVYEVLQCDFIGLEALSLKFSWTDILPKYDKLTNGRAGFNSL